MEFYRLTAHELVELLDSGRVQGDELLLQLKERIDTVDPEVKAYVRPGSPVEV